MKTALSLLVALIAISFSHPCNAGFLPVFEPVWEQSGKESCDLAKTVAFKGSTLFRSDKAAGTKILVKARELCPDDKRYVYNLGAALYQQGLVADARPLLEEAAGMRRAPSYWENNVAVALMELKEEPSKALKYAEAAAYGDRDNAAVQETLAKARMAAGKRLDALEGLHKALARHPQDKLLKENYRKALDGYLAFCWSEFKSGKEQAGLAGFKAAEFEPEACRARALALCELGRGEEALAVAAAAEKKHKQQIRLVEEVAELVVDDLYRKFADRKEVPTIERAKKLAAAYPVKPLVEAYNSLLEALLNDTPPAPRKKPAAAKATAAEGEKVAPVDAGGASAGTGGDPAEAKAPKSSAAVGARVEIVSVTLDAEDGSHVAKKGMPAKLVITLKNPGDQEARGVGLLLETDKAIQIKELKNTWRSRNSSPVITDPAKASSFSLRGGKSAVLAFTVEVGEEFAGSELPVLISLVTSDPSSLTKSQIKIPYDPVQRKPKLEMTSLKVRAPGGGTAVTRGGESEVVLVLKNAGDGIAKSVGVLVETKVEDIVIGRVKKRWQLWRDDSMGLVENHDTVTTLALAPGESREVAFTVTAGERFKGEEVPVSIKLLTKNPDTAATLPVKIAYDTNPAATPVAENATDTALAFLNRITSVFTGAGDETDPLQVSVPSGFGTFGEKDHAVVIGIERYRGEIPPAEFSNNDARAMKKYLVALGFQERNIDILTDDRATLADIRATVERKLMNRARKQSRVFFYYSGHGAPDPANGESYLVPFDGDPNYIADTGYSLSQLYSALGKLPASEVTVVLDTCFSGTGGRSVMAKGVRPLVVKSKRAVVPENVAVVTSTDGAQISTTYQEGRHGLFTWFFLKAISEGKKNLDEIYQYLRPQVEDEAKRRNIEQRPSLNVDSKEGAMMFVLQQSKEGQ